MKTKVTVLLSLLLLACTESPLGRKQLLLMPESQMAQMGATAYSEMKTQQAVVTDAQAVSYVRCVTAAITTSLGGNGSWEVNLFRDDSANAFALPGGKIGVNTGLLKVAETPDQLAAVIGHEIGHVMAQHGNERMSIQMATQTGMQLMKTLSGEPSEEKQMLFGLLGLGAQFGVTLPYSRAHESEADLIGLKLMAAAGFDPRASVTLWQNMAHASGGAPPEFLSTHPSSQTRIEALRANMAQALPIYEKAKAGGRTPDCRP